MVIKKMEGRWKWEIKKFQKEVAMAVGDDFAVYMKREVEHEVLVKELIREIGKKDNAIESLRVRVKRLEEEGVVMGAGEWQEFISKKNERIKELEAQLRKVRRD